MAIQADSDIAKGELLKAFDSQIAYMLSGVQASPAIAYGRSAALAKMLGFDSIAKEASAKIAKIDGMPSFEEFYTGCLAHPENFGAFADKVNFPELGSAFSNAAGSYAFAMDYLANGEQALAGGQPEWVCKWGATSLHAAGFEGQAKKLDALAAQTFTAKTAGVGSILELVKGLGL